MHTRHRPHKNEHSWSADDGGDAVISTSNQRETVAATANVAKKETVADKEKAVQSYETLQVIAALQAAFGLGLFSELRDTKWTSHLVKEVWEGGVVLLVVANLVGLCVLSSQLFYLYQALGKDDSGGLYDAFAAETKEWRQVANRSIIYTMPLAMALTTCVFVQHSEPGLARIFGYASFGVAGQMWHLLNENRRRFKRLRTAQKKPKKSAKVTQGGKAEC